MKSFARVAVVGVASVALLKVFTAVFLPALGMLFGLLLLVAKAAAIGAVIYFLWTVLRDRTTESDEPTTHHGTHEEEVEIVVETVEADVEEEAEGGGEGSA